LVADLELKRLLGGGLVISQRQQLSLGLPSVWLVQAPLVFAANEREEVDVEDPPAIGAYHHQRLLLGDSDYRVRFHSECRRSRRRCRVSWLVEPLPSLFPTGPAHTIEGRCAERALQRASARWQHLAETVSH